MVVNYLDEINALVVKKQRVDMLIKASEVAESVSLSLDDLALVMNYLYPFGVVNDCM